MAAVAAGSTLVAGAGPDAPGEAASSGLAQAALVTHAGWPPLPRPVLTGHAGPVGETVPAGQAVPAERASLAGSAAPTEGTRRAARVGGYAASDPADSDLHAHDPEAAAARDMVTASTLAIDPALLEAQPDDSEDTLAARAELALLAARVEAVLADYDAAAGVAHRRQERSGRVHRALLDAREEAAAAQRDYLQDREELVAMVNGAYVAGSLGAVGMVLSSDDETDLVAGMTIAEQLNLDKSAIVLRAQESAERLERASAEADTLDREAREAARRSARALARAERARDEVADDVAAARLVLAGSVLADQAQQAVDAAALEGLQLATGSVVFPLAPGATFVDQDNFGGTGSRWAAYHTGVDFSAACGTPVLAATAGTVEVRTDQPWSGRWLVVVRSDASTVATWYAHMQALAVEDGEQVQAGQVVGAVGTEGNSTGCHLHFEYHPAGGSIYEDASDPVAWLQAVGAYPWS